MTGARKPDSPLLLYRLPPRDRVPQAIQDHDCVVALKALGEDTRVRIIGALMGKPLEVGEISKQLGVSPYNVSKHLRILREAGLLEVRKDGRKHLYALRAAVRGRAAAGAVLDLGCCSFQFQGAPEQDTSPSTPPRRPRRRSGTPASHPRRAMKARV